MKVSIVCIDEIHEPTHIKGVFLKKDRAEELVKKIKVDYQRHPYTYISIKEYEVKE